MAEVVMRLAELSADEEMRVLMDAKEKIARDKIARERYVRDEGRAEGEAKAAVRFARQLFQSGLPLTDIARFTGLPMTEVERLAAEEDA